jgi:hypothetical protein
MSDTFSDAILWSVTHVTVFGLSGCSVLHKAAVQPPISSFVILLNTSIGVCSPTFTAFDVLGFTYPARRNWLISRSTKLCK